MTFAPRRQRCASPTARTTGHHRTPGYLKGKTGTVARVHDRVPNPETRAYGERRAAALAALPRRVRAGASSGPRPSAATTIACSPTSSSTGWSRRRERPRTITTTRTTRSDATASRRRRTRTRARGAARREGRRRRARRCDARIDWLVSRTPADGARLVARAWIDDGVQGAPARGRAAGRTRARRSTRASRPQVVALENTDDVHHMVVCTLCSCYPRALLGPPPDWYKSLPYRSRAVSDPRGVLREFGLTLDDDVELRVVDSTADIRYLVVPRRPAGTESSGRGRARRARHARLDDRRLAASRAGLTHLLGAGGARPRSPFRARGSTEA